MPKINSVLNLKCPYCGRVSKIYAEYFQGDRFYITFFPCEYGDCDQLFIVKLPSVINAKIEGQKINFPNSEIQING